MIAAPARQVAELLRQVDDARQARQGEYERFLTDLTPRLSAAGIAERFLLVYLPPVHREPDEASLPKVDRERWRGHFRVMPYTGGDPSLDDWLATCRVVVGVPSTSR